MGQPNDRCSAEVVKPTGDLSMGCTRWSPHGKRAFAGCDRTSLEPDGPGPPIRHSCNHPFLTHSRLPSTVVGKPPPRC